METPVQLDLRLSSEQPDGPAVQQLLWRVDDEAAIRYGAPGIEAAAEADIPGEARHEVDREEIVRPRLFAEMRRLGDQVVDPPELRLRDVVQPADLIAAGARQARIRRRGDAVGTVALGTDLEVVGRADVVKPVAIVAGRSRRSRR